MSEETSSYDVFISYARRDGLQHAERLECALTAAGFSTWRDKRGLDPDQDFTAELERTIEQSAWIVCCLTPDTRRNDSFVRREISYALALEKPVIPLIFNDTLPPIQIINVTRQDFTHTPWGQAFHFLVARLRRSDHALTRQVSPPEDHYRRYLEVLYRQIVALLKQTVLSELTLHSRTTTGAVETKATTALPLIFWEVMEAAPGESGAESAGFASFGEAFSLYTGRVLLLGEPGAGKTTTLLAFARDKVAERLQDAHLPLPVIAPIATWNPQETTPLADWLADQIPMLDRDDLRRLITAGDALLMLDGLDELGCEREDLETHARYDPRLRFLRMIPQVGQVVVTCRAHEYAEMGTRIGLNGAVKLSPLSDAQMQDYLESLPSLWGVLKSDAELLEVARTPLLLTLFRFGFSELGDGGSLATAGLQGELRDHIFARYVEKRYEHERRRHGLELTLDEIYDVLGPAALASELAEHAGDLTPVLEESFRQAHLESALLSLDRLIDLHLLVGERPGSLRFMHLLLRDYFAVRTRQHVPDWKRRVVGLLGRLHTGRALNVLSAWFPDPEVGELARDAVWKHFCLEPGPLRSSASIALDRWDDYVERHPEFR